MWISKKELLERIERLEKFRETDYEQREYSKESRTLFGLPITFSVLPRHNSVALDVLSKKVNLLFEYLGVEAINTPEVPAKTIIQKKKKAKK